MEIKSLRCFFAVLLDEATRIALHQLATQIKKQYPQTEIKWVPQNNYHLTLRFMGNIEVTSIASLSDHLRQYLKNCPGFAVEMHTPVLFPKHHPHVISLKVEPEKSLLILAHAIEQAVISAGFTPESRSFQAHLTLARLKQLPAALTFESFSTRIKTSVTEVALVQSQLGETGSVYTVLETFRLQEKNLPYT